MDASPTAPWLAGLKTDLQIARQKRIPLRIYVPRSYRNSATDIEPDVAVLLAERDGTDTFAYESREDLLHLLMPI